jgi:hypothetical protein
MTTLLRVQIWLIAWQYKLSLSARLRTQIRKELEQTVQWKRLRQDQQRVIATLKGLELQEYTKALLELNEGTTRLMMLTREQISILDSFLKKLSSEPRVERTELLALLGLFRQIRAVRKRNQTA